MTSHEITAFSKRETGDDLVPQATSIGIEGALAAVGGLAGDVGVFSTETGKIERSSKVPEPVLDTVWADTKIVVATVKGSVIVTQDGKTVAHFTDHAGPATGLALHPSGGILASVGSDKSFILYDLAALKPVSRSYTDSCKFNEPRAMSCLRLWTCANATVPAQH